MQSTALIWGLTGWAHFIKVASIGYEVFMGDELDNGNSLESKFKDIAFLDKIFSSAGEGIIISNGSGKIYLANERAARVFGYQKGELEQYSIEDLVPQDIKAVHHKHRSSYMQSPRSRPMGLGVDLKGLRKDGSVFPIEISLSHFDHGGNIWVVAFIIDISLRKAQEQEIAQSRKKLQEYANELEIKVKERTSEIEHMNLGLRSQIRERKMAEQALKASLKDLERARAETLKALDKEKELNELKSRFISMASHEFRTPLTTISSSAELISKYELSEQQLNRARHVERIRNAVKNLTKILNDFLSLEKLETGRLDLNLEWIETSHLLVDLKEEFSISLKAGQKLVLEKKNLPRLYTDKHILKNILINLVSNAIKYSPEGKSIEVNIKEQEEETQIEIVDFGLGIPKAEQKNMFQRFFRAKNVSNLQGTGLGLTIVKRYAEILGGNITFVSEEGKGSAFTIGIPKAEIK